MSITYSWAFGPLQCVLSENGLTNIVKTVHWRLSGTDGAHTKELGGAVVLDAPSADQDFTAFDSLSQDTVREWVESKLDVKILKDAIADELATMSQPVMMVASPPWEEKTATMTEPVPARVAAPVEEPKPRAKARSKK